MSPGCCSQRHGPSSRKRPRQDRADRGRTDDVGLPNASRGLFLGDRAADHTAKGPQRKRPPTEAAPTFQTKIAKTVAPSKTSVHASGIANHFGLALVLSWFTPYLVKALGFSQDEAGKLTALDGLLRRAAWKLAIRESTVSA